MLALRIVRTALFAGAHSPAAGSGAAQPSVERQVMVDALRESKERLDLAVSATNGGLWDIPLSAASPGGCVPGDIYLSPTLKQLIGFEDSELPNTLAALFARIHPDDVTNFFRLVEEHLRKPSEMIEAEYRIQHKDGSLRWFNLRGKLFTNPQDGSQRIVGISWDITAQKQSQAERELLFEQVRQGRERLRALATKVVNAQEEERRRISRELHDEVGQNLTVLGISLRMLQNDLEDQPEAVRQRIRDAIHLSDATMAHIRSLAQDLRPPSLDTLGLNAALEGLCSAFAQRTQLPVDYEGCEFTDVNEAVRIALYRFLQEALTNAARHSTGDRVWVHLKRGDNFLELAIRDNGQGFTEQAGAAGTAGLREGGIGLIGMRERIEMVGGAVQIDSRPGEGACVSARVPFKGLFIERRTSRDQSRNRG